MKPTHDHLVKIKRNLIDNYSPYGLGKLFASAIEM